MSDPPPRPKPGSLRDRIAAFESQASQPPSLTPPPPRPKPGGLQWKPKQPPPPSNNDNASLGTGAAGSTTGGGSGSNSTVSSPSAASFAVEKPKSPVGMSATDARESIKQGGSLKDRMAALQGRGAFGGPPPPGQGSHAPTPPVAPKPKWKPPPQVSVVPAEGEKEEKKEEQEEEEGREDRRKPKQEDEDEESGELDAEKHSPAAPQVKMATESSEVTTHEDGEQAAVDPEEEERQRRAAIAARMAKLGGARVGMAPPGMFGGARPSPPPLDKKPKAPKEPVPAAVNSAPEETEKELETAAVTPAPLPAPESPGAHRQTPELSAAGSPPAQSKGPLSMPVPAVPRRTAPPRRKTPKSPAVPPPEPEVATEVRAAVAEAQERQEVLKDLEPLTKGEKREVEVPPEEVEMIESLPEKAEIDAEETVQKAPHFAAEEELGEETELEEARAEGPTLVEEPVEEPESQGVEEEEDKAQEEEDEEEARRKRIAERLAKMGGVNPLHAPPRRTISTDDAEPGPGPLRRTSVDSASSGGLGRRTSVDSAKDFEHGVQKSAVSGIPEQDERDEVEHEKEEYEEEEDEVNDALAASIIMERQPEVEEEGERDIVPIPRPPLRRSSGFVTMPPQSDEEWEQQVPTRKEEEEQGRASPPPLPVSPRISAMAPRAGSFGGHLTQEGEIHHKDDVPVPVPHRSASLRSSLKRSGIEENEEEQDDRAEKEKEKEVKHVPPPPTRRVSLPPPPVEDTDAGIEHKGELEQEESEPVPASAHSDKPLTIPPPTVGRRLSKDDTVRDRPLPHPMSVRRPRAPAVTVESIEGEIMDDEEGDPIDPSFHSPKRSQLSSPSLSQKAELQDKDPEKDKEKEKTDEADSGPDVARRRTIAERMVKLGGIKFGAAPLPILAPKVPSVPTERGAEVEGKEREEATAEESDNKQLDEEEEERARKGRIAAKLAGMGGMRIGMIPSGMGIPPRHPQRPQPHPPAPTFAPDPSPISPVAPVRGPPTRLPPPPQHSAQTSPRDAEWEQDSMTTSEEGVKVEMEESELEEVHHEDAKLDDAYEGEILAPPLPPPRVQRQPSSPAQRTRPPVPSTVNVRRLSGGTVSTLGRKGSSGSTTTTTTTTSSYRPAQGQSEYVMVEEPQDYDSIEVPPPLPPAKRSQRVAPSHPPPSPPRAPPLAMSDSISSQWELPSIPSGGLGSLGTDLSSSWTVADESLSRSTPVPGLGSHPSSAAVRAAPVTAAQPRLSPDDLIATWGRVGVQIFEVAATMYEKSKKSLVGDGTYTGFVNGVLNEVPNAARPAYGTSASEWGYLVYAQTGSAVQRRTSDIMPGDVIELVDARFKGHKGLQAYTHHAGASGEALVGVVSGTEPKKSKVKVFQANQHVGQQTVETASYKLEDLKSGTLKVYRVLEAQ